MQPPLWIALGTVIGAVLAGGFQWIVASRRSKSQLEIARLQLRAGAQKKIAEFRQDWIHRLRDELAEFQSYGVTPNLNQAEKREFFSHGTRVELLMSPKDPDYGELVRCLYEFLEADSTTKKYSANPAFISVSQRILKREWEVLKREIAADFD